MRPSNVSASHKDTIRTIITIAILCLLLFIYIQNEVVQEAVLSLIFPQVKQLTHSRKTIWEMTGAHLLLTVSATTLALVFGVSLGIAVTRKGGRDFQQLVLRFNAFIQTFPPSAVIILAFPVLGFGWQPALLAMFLYSLFPILGNTVVGFNAVRDDVKDSARGMGMTAIQQLWIAEFPQAFPMIITGLRHSYILNLGTAAIAAVIGGEGLGTIIISGLTLRNSALVLSGTIVIALLAFIGEQFFQLIAKMYRT